MKKFMSFLKQTDYRHYICVGISVAFVLLLLICFFRSIPRIVDACVSFGTSIAFYFCELMGVKHHITPTVIKMPDSILSWFPATLEEFKADFLCYWQLVIAPDSFRGYGSALTSVLEVVSKVLLLIVPVIVLFVVLSVTASSKRNNRHGANTLPLRIWKKVTAGYPHVKAWVQSCFVFFA